MSVARAMFLYLGMLIDFFFFMFQLLLEAPDDIYCFKFNPTDPNIIAGGCLNGQVVLWDISQHADKLKTSRSSTKKKGLNTLVGLNTVIRNSITFFFVCVPSYLQFPRM